MLARSCQTLSPSTHWQSQRGAPLSSNLATTTTLQCDCGLGGAGASLGKTTHNVNRSKIHRRKTYALGVAIDHSMRMTLKRKLADLCVPEEERKAGLGAWDWQLVHAASDKGPDCVCLAHFCRWCLRLNIEWHWDPSHGGVGCLRAAVSKAGLACRAYCAYFAYNATYGEWRNGDRIEQVRASIKSATASNTHSSDEAFQFAQTRFRHLPSPPPDDRTHYGMLRTTGGCWQHGWPRISLS